MTTEQTAELSLFQLTLTSLVSILDKETTIASETRSENGISNENIVNLNNSLEFVLAAINHIVNSTYLLPVIIDFTPTHAEEGDTITITGANLDNAVVKFNGVTATILSNTSSEIVCTIPEGATTGVITVETIGGITVTTDLFTVDIPL